MTLTNSKKVKRIVNNRLIPIKQKLDAIERRLKAYFNCPFCGFDQGKPDPYFGTGLTLMFMRLMKGYTTGFKTATEMAGDDDLIIHGPKCGCRSCKKINIAQEGQPGGFTIPTPDLPLHAGVAKALGLEVVSGDKYYPDYKWYKIFQFHPQAVRKHKKQWFFYEIPDYPNDLVAAMGAFWKYLEMNRLNGIIVRNPDGSVRIVINYQTVVRRNVELTARDFCEAIVAHAEGK